MNKIQSDRWFLRGAIGRFFLQTAVWFDLAKTKQKMNLISLDWLAEIPVFLDSEKFGSACGFSASVFHIHFLRLATTSKLNIKRLKSGPVFSQHFF